MGHAVRVMVLATQAFLFGLLSVTAAFALPTAVRTPSLLAANVELCYNMDSKGAYGCAGGSCLEENKVAAEIGSFTYLYKTYSAMAFSHVTAKCVTVQPCVSVVFLTAACPPVYEPSDPKYNFGTYTTPCPQGSCCTLGVTLPSGVMFSDLENPASSSFVSISKASNSSSLNALLNQQQR